MVFGIGTDILRDGQLVEECLSNGDPFLQRVYTQEEREEARLRKNSYKYYCSRFSGKEAILKCLHMDSDEVRLSEIEILTAENGEPYVRLHGNIGEKAKEWGIKHIFLSLSHDTDYYIAYALAER